MRNFRIWMVPYFSIILQKSYPPSTEPQRKDGKKSNCSSLIQVPTGQPCLTSEKSHLLSAIAVGLHAILNPTSSCNLCPGDKRLMVLAPNQVVCSQWSLAHLTASHSVPKMQISTYLLSFAKSYSKWTWLILEVTERIHLQNNFMVNSSYWFTAARPQICSSVIMDRFL